MPRRLLWLITVAGSALFAQTNAVTPLPKTMAADAKPSFEVATVKPTLSRDQAGSIQVTPSGAVYLTNFPVMVLIGFAYNIPRRQISGGPSWLGTERFDIVGKPDLEGAPSMNQLRMMMQKLLTERFLLSLAHEKKQLPAYALTVAKGGPNLTEAVAGLNELPKFLGTGGLQGRSIENSTMVEFADSLRGSVGDRTVVDRTGLGPKRYSFTLKWAPDAADNPDAIPDIFAAIQQQLGLKLESTQTLVDMIVINHVEKPSEN